MHTCWYSLSSTVLTETTLYCNIFPMNPVQCTQLSQETGTAFLQRHVLSKQFLMFRACKLQSPLFYCVEAEIRYFEKKNGTFKTKLSVALLPSTYLYTFWSITLEKVDGHCNISETIFNSHKKDFLLTLELNGFFPHFSNNFNGWIGFWIIHLA